MMADMVGVPFPRKNTITMMPDYHLYALLTPAEMAKADQYAVRQGVTVAQLMETAGAAVAQAVMDRWTPRPTIVLCGPGNNGGDGLVAARHLQAAGWPIQVAVLGHDASPGLNDGRTTLWPGPVVAATPQMFDGAALVVDALFGAGLSRPLAGAAAQLVEAMASSALPICAVDMPSGVDGSSGQ